MNEPKRCRRCRIDKPLADFPANSRYRDGRSSWCRPCHVAATRQWRRDHRDQYNARTRARYHSEDNAR